MPPSGRADERIQWHRAWDAHRVNQILSGIFVGVLVFFGLLFAFAGGTGPLELLLWLVLGIVSGVVVTKLLRLGSADET